MENIVLVSPELREFWVAIFVIAFSMGLILFLKWHKRWLLKRSDIRSIDRMSGKRFEEYLEELFKRLGYKVKMLDHASDFGGDLVIEKDGVRTLVQAKRYSKSVGIKAVQEVVGAKRHYVCTRAMVVTNNYFTSAAFKLARSNYVTLWNRKRLINAVLRSKKK